MRLPTAKYEVYMKKWFYSLGVSIGTHPKRWITVLLMVTAVSCVGFVRFHQINNARVTFTAHDSPSHTEGAKFDEFLRQNGTLHMIEVLISSADGGNLLRTDHLNQLNEMTKWMRNGIKVDDNGRLMGYQDMCEPYCDKNEAFFAVVDLFQANSSNFEITYPKTSLFGHQILVANGLYGVETYPGTQKIRSFNTVMLRFYLTNPTLKPLLAFENELIDICYHSDKWPLLIGQVGSDSIVAKEVKKLGTSTAPYLGLSLVLLCGFLIICSLRYRRSESKPLEACLGALIPVLSGLTTVGMVSATGLAFQSIIVSTLFLVLAIGIDDVFIILSAWHRADKTISLGHRVGLTVQEAGCSMTVTTITNLISFGNGVLSTTPVLQTFAIYSSVASVICYLYQLIIFPAILAITADNEEPQKITDIEQDNHFWPFIKTLSAWSDKKWESLTNHITSSDKKNITRILTISILLGYWYLSGVGISTMKTDLSIQKMADKTAAIVKFKDTADKVLREMQSVGILIDKPQDLRVPENLEEMKLVIREFESAINSYGEGSTMCWLNSYLEWIAFFKENGMEEELETEFDGDSGGSGASSTSSGAQNHQNEDSRASGSFGASPTSPKAEKSDSGASGAFSTTSGAPSQQNKKSGASGTSSLSSGAHRHLDKDSGAFGAPRHQDEASGAFGASPTSSEALNHKNTDSGVSRTSRRSEAGKLISGASGATSTSLGAQRHQDRNSGAPGESSTSSRAPRHQDKVSVASKPSEAEKLFSGASGPSPTSSEPGKSDSGAQRHRNKDSGAPRASGAFPTSSGAPRHQVKDSEASGASSTSSGAQIPQTKDSDASSTSSGVHGLQTRRRRDSESLKASRDPSPFTYTDLPAFLLSEPQYLPMLRLNTSLCLQNHPECLQKFLFTTGFTSVVKYQEMYPMVLNWRKIAKDHEKLGIYAYTERSNFVDQTADMVENIWITVVSEVVCMAISFVFFIPDTVSIISAVFSLLSVNFGVFGFLSIWKVGMDPVSLASLLMSIGFSVDISAHISYHYYQVDKASPREKLLHVYTHIGWPTVQGGLSTMLAMMPILLCPSYLGMVFLKTVILVSTFGLLHGLIVLPVFLTLFSEISEKCSGFRSFKISDKDSQTDIAIKSSNLPTQISIESFDKPKH